MMNPTSSGLHLFRHLSAALEQVASLTLHRDHKENQTDRGLLWSFSREVDNSLFQPLLTTGLFSSSFGPTGLKRGAS